MKDLLKHLNEMAKDEEEGYQKYVKLFLVFDDIGDRKISRYFSDMARDEREHKRVLKEIIRMVKKDYSRLRDVY